uniref:Calmodulin-binding family protein n=1 Tax=Rhizophora mucronata TaxID=61149 RepID=A0A2P2KRV0_RHIMU
MILEKIRSSIHSTTGVLRANRISEESICESFLFVSFIFLVIILFMYPF